MDYTDSEILILEIQKHECLYDMKHSNYKNRNAKADAWANISRTVYGEGWEELDQEIKTKNGKEIQKRWKSLKDAYFRSIKNREGKSGGTKKPYLFEKQMQFIKTVLYSRPTSGTVNEFNEVDEIVNEDVVKTEIVEHGGQSSTLSNGEARKKPIPKRKQGEPDAFEKEMLQVIKKSTTIAAPQPVQLPHCESIDEDKMFLLSLFPYMKQMSTVNKLEFQVEIIQAVKKIIEKQHSNPH